MSERIPGPAAATRPDWWRLTGRRALVADDGRGWTGHLARALATAGAAVAIVGGDAARVAASAAQAREAGGEAFELVAGQATSEAAAGAVGRVVERLGGLDILVNQSLAAFGKPFLENAENEWAQVFERNVNAMLRWCRAAGAHMVGQGSGRIINIMSGLAARGLPNSVAYCAAQGAVHQATRALALEWARSGVRVNGIGVGWYDLERLPQEVQRRELLVRYLPLRRKGHPSDIASLLVYLASDASDFVSGQTIFVDGGALAHA